MPVTTPVVASMVAIAGLAQVQVPPLTACDNDVVAPAHTLNVPVMAAGVLFTVTGFVL